MSDRSLRVTVGGDVGPLHSALRSGASSVSVFVNQVSSTSVAAGVALANIGMSAVSMASDIASSVGRAGVSFASWGVQLAAEAEQAEIAFGVMLGSTDKAKTLLADLAQFGAETPFELPGLRDAAKSLLAFGTPAEEMLPTLRALGDVASGLNIPLNDLSQIYGKARVQGRLFMEDINQLSGRGIPIITLLAEQFGVAEGEVRKLVEKGKVGFPQLEQAFADMTKTGGQFAGMMDQQSASLLGRWSTLMDGIGAIARDIGQIIIEEFGFSDLLDDGTTLTTWFQEEMLPTVRLVMRDIATMTLKVIDYVRKIGASALDIAADFEPAVQAVKQFAILTLRLHGNLQAMRGDVKGAVETGIQMGMLEMMNTGTISDGLKQQAEALRVPFQDSWNAMMEGMKKDSAAITPKPKQNLQGLIDSRVPSLGDIGAKAQAGLTTALNQFAGLLPQRGAAGKEAIPGATAGLDVGGREAFSAIQARKREGDRSLEIQKEQLAALKAIATAVTRDAARTIDQATDVLGSFFSPAAS